MSQKEAQEEEREVLLSIYDGDSSFHQLDPVTFQYKYGQDGDAKSFLLEINWTDGYPDEKPKINLETFYNQHLTLPVKNGIIEALSQEAEQYLGSAMTYSLFEFAKEQAADLTREQPEHEVASLEEELTKKALLTSQPECSIQSREKKEHLTKAQKRRQWDRAENSRGEKPRGWNWVDIVKHLSQTGCQDSE